MTAKLSFLHDVALLFEKDWTAEKEKTVAALYDYALEREMKQKNEQIKALTDQKSRLASTISRMADAALFV